MLYLALLVIIAVPLVLVGWLIGRLFVKAPVPGAQGRHALKPMKIEILVADLLDHRLNGRSQFGINSDIRRFIQLVAVPIKEQGKGANYEREIQIHIRPIGKWTFAPALGPGHQDEYEATSGHGPALASIWGERAQTNPGHAFLQPNQILIQPSLSSDGKDLLLTFHSSQSAHSNPGCDPLAGNESFGFDGVILDNWLEHGQGANRLMAFMSAYLACWQTALRPSLLPLAARYIGRHTEWDIDLQSATNRQELYRGEWQWHALTGWINGALGHDLYDAKRTDHALFIFRHLIKTANGQSAHPRQERPASRVQISLYANAARAAVQSFELSGRNPERLLEADEYCQTALENSDFIGRPDMAFELHLLCAQSHRYLAVHDRSARGLDRAWAILDEVNLQDMAAAHAAGHAGRHATRHEASAARLALERGHLYLARGKLSGELSLTALAKKAFQDAVDGFDGEGIAGGARLEALLGLADCLNILGRENLNVDPCHRAVRLIENEDKRLAKAMYSAHDRTFETFDRKAVLYAQLKLYKVEALYQLGILTPGDVTNAAEYFEAALTTLESIPEFSSEAWAVQKLSVKARVMKAKIFLAWSEMSDNLKLTESAIFSISLVPGIYSHLDGANGLSSHISSRDRWQLMAGLARAALKVGGQRESLKWLASAERRGAALLALARALDDHLCLAEAECLRADIKARQFDLDPIGNVADIEMAISGVRRALDYTPRGSYPGLWAARQNMLGGLLAKYGEINIGTISDLSAAVRAYEKSLAETDIPASQPERVRILQELGQTLSALSRRSGDPAHRVSAEAAFAEAYDAGQSGNLAEQARKAEYSLARLRGETFH